jgi:hypothetical protein
LRRLATRVMKFPGTEVFRRDHPKA